MSTPAQQTTAGFAPETAPDLPTVDGAVPSAPPRAAQRLFGPGPASGPRLESLPPMNRSLSGTRDNGRRPLSVAASHPGAESVWEEIRLEVERHAMATETRRSYERHQSAWKTWCTERGLAWRDATARQVAEHLAAYLVEADEHGRAVRDDDGQPVAAITATTLRQRLAAIDHAFEAAGLARPGRDPQVQTFMRGARRLYGVAPVHAKAPILLPDLRRLVARVLAERTTAQRDDLLAHLHERHLATPGQLARLSWSHVDLSGKDAKVILPPTRRGGDLSLVRVRATGTTHCPVQALREMRAGAEPDGPVLAGPTGSRLTRQAIDKHLRAHGRPAADHAGRGKDGTHERIPTKALRDSALLTTGWFAALRRSNLVMLRWSDITWMPDGDVRLRLRRSKTDQEGEGNWNWLPALPGDPACPVAALAAWRNRAAQILGGDPAALFPEDPVFPALTRHGRISRGTRGRARHLRGADVNEVIQLTAIAAGLTSAEAGQRNPYGGHSLRAGFVTQACLNGMPLIDIAAVTHHEDLRSLRVYARMHASQQGLRIRQMILAAAA